MGPDTGSARPTGPTCLLFSLPLSSPSPQSNPGPWRQRGSGRGGVGLPCHLPRAPQRAPHSPEPRAQSPEPQSRRACTDRNATRRAARGSDSSAEPPQSRKVRLARWGGAK